VLATYQRITRALDDVIIRTAHVAVCLGMLSREQ
jgi:hypothetical protein